MTIKIYLEQHFIFYATFSKILFLLITYFRQVFNKCYIFLLSYSIHFKPFSRNIWTKIYMNLTQKHKNLYSKELVNWEPSQTKTFIELSQGQLRVGLMSHWTPGVRSRCGKKTVWPYDKIRFKTLLSPITLTPFLAF